MGGSFHGIKAASKEDALSIAAASSKLPEMEKLLADGVDINARSSRGDTPLVSAASMGNVRAVELLIRSGADLNAPGRHDLTPLMTACSNGKVKGSRIALQLIEAGADVSCVRSDGMTALKFAAQACTADVLEALIAHGAAVDGPPGTDQTPLMLAARANHVDALRVLVKHGADVNRSCNLPWAGGRTAEGLAELERRTLALRFLRGLRNP